LEKSHKKEERKQKISLALKLTTYMKQNGASIKEISKETGLSFETIVGLQKVCLMSDVTINLTI